MTAQVPVVVPAWAQIEQENKSEIELNGDLRENNRSLMFRSPAAAGFVSLAVLFVLLAALADRSAGIAQNETWDWDRAHMYVLHSFSSHCSTRCVVGWWRSEC